MAPFEIYNRKQSKKNSLTCLQPRRLTEGQIWIQELTMDCCCSLDWMLADGESSHDTLGH